MGNKTDYNSMTVNHLKATLDKLISDGKGDYEFDLSIKFKDAIANNDTKNPKIDITVNVNDKNKIVTLSEIISF
jgi:hypothetical protein